MLSVGLNPYCPADSLGLHAAGTQRANPRPMGLDDYVALARRLGVGGIEIHAEHLFECSEAKLRGLREAFDGLGWWVVLARPLMMDCWDRTLAVAAAFGARVIRMHCTAVLCGDRVTNCDWPGLVGEVRRRLAAAS